MQEVQINDMRATVEQISRQNPEYRTLKEAGSLITVHANGNPIAQTFVAEKVGYDTKRTYARRVHKATRIMLQLAMEATQPYKLIRRSKWRFLKFWKRKDC